MQLVLLSPDLMLIALAQGAANRHSASLMVAGDMGSTIAACENAPLVVVDLRTQGLDVELLMTELRRVRKDIHVMACGPHVHEVTLARAAAAGCDEVVTRGQFEQRLDAALVRLASGTS